MLPILYIGRFYQVMRRTRRHDIKHTDIINARRDDSVSEPKPNDGTRLEGRHRDLDFKQVSRQRRRVRRKRFFLRFLVFLAFVAAILIFLRSSYFAIKDIKVEGMSYYTGQEIVNMSGAELGRNLVFDSGKNEIIDTLESNPYFKSIKIKKKLPSTLIIQVEERPQAASVAFGESYIVIDEEGTVLRKTDVNPRLTLLVGLTISKMNVGEKLEAEESDTLSMTLRMLGTMQDGDIYFKKIDVSKVVIKAYIYDNLIVKGTPGEMTEAIEKGELQKVVSNLFKDNISRGTIKMGGSSYISFTPEIEDE